MRKTIGTLVTLGIASILVFSLLLWAARAFIYPVDLATQVVASYNQSFFGDVPQYLLAFASWFAQVLARPIGVALLILISMILIALEMRRS